MSHKKIIGVLLGLSIVGILTGFMFGDMTSSGLCRDKYVYQWGDPDNVNSISYIGCLDPIQEKVGQPLFIGSIALTLIFLILIFFPKPYFTAWRKFAIWFVPLAALWVFTSPTSGGSGLGVGLSFDRELAIFWSSGIYVVVSLLIIIIKAFRRPAKPTNDIRIS